MPGYDDETRRMGGWDQQPPPRRPVSSTPYVNAPRLWSGGVATAVVAILIGIVGVLVVRALLQISVVSPKSGTAFDNGDTVVLCASAAVAALLATGLAHLLLLGTPRPLAYLGWIVGLVTAISAIWPFVSGAPILVAVARAVIHLIIGLAIGSLVTGAAASASRQPRPQYDDTRYDR